ncbi:c-type cytochrome biogenesis protein CcmI [Methylomonas lenta]|uniref:c-type cytochrome biogenesis protein CcmI n=1 Tax=Methylomonas lenta TaxID=980561 RepID=UPI00082C1120|nr:c-type cytochrome biogenesis protein CcmI [Methylomonas lenta]
MNTLFWIVVAGFLLLALVILLPALLKNQLLIDGDHQQRNIKIARQRLSELNQQLQDGVLSQTLFDEQYAELQLMLNDDLETSAMVQTKPQQGRWIIPMLAVLLPTLSLLIYLMLGETNALRKAELQETETKAAVNVINMVEKLQQRLKQQPDDIQGWKMLGRSYTYLQQYQNAADVYAELYRRQPDDLEVMLQYANNLAMARGGRMAGEPAELISLVLQRAPDNPNALWLGGIAKAEEGQYAEAKQRWQKLVSLLPADSESLPQVKQMLLALDAEQAKKSSAPPSVNINIQVDIEPALKAKMQPDTTVFIYAQAVNGPKMPLAIVRKKLADLPVKVILNDSMAMQPTTRLGDYQQLRILARVSQSGQAMPAAGDLIGSVEFSQPFQNQVASVLINQEVK